MIFFLIALVVVLIASLVIHLKCVKGKNLLVDHFANCNCIVFGKKGTGKDLIFNKVINARKSKCSSNIEYNTKFCSVRSILSYNISPNTYKDFLTGDIIKIQKRFHEKRDYYISDGGIALPSQYQADLCKLYPSLPITYALSRHLALFNIHINTQNLSRVWDKLREQADAYFKTTKTLRIKFLGLIFTFGIFYEEYESAKLNLRPYRKGFFASAPSRANYEDFESTHGIVKKFMICQKIKNVKYDTRYFHSVLYGVPAPTK